MIKVDESFSFREPLNLAIFTTKQVIERSHPIVYVTHDRDDGAWQFLCGTTNDDQDIRLIALGEIIKMDPSLKELADLPLGWEARRRDANDDWRRSRSALG